MEAALLGCFMISAAGFATLIAHPGSPVSSLIQDPLLRRVVMGVAMAGTLACLVFSPWGKQSGAHMNPSVTLTFWRLGKVAGVDACWYAIAQFVGGVGGISLIALVAGTWVSHPSVSYVATLPGEHGLGAAFAGEIVISSVLMFTVLSVSSSRRWARYTGLFAAALVASYITLESPISGMSMNPARSFGPALVGGLWQGLWIYFTAPPLGMLLGAQLYLGLCKARPVLCAKLHHHNDKRCIFRCGYAIEAETSCPAPASNERVSQTAGPI